MKGGAFDLQVDEEDDVDSLLGEFMENELTLDEPVTTTLMRDLRGIGVKVRLRRLRTSLLRLLWDILEHHD